MKTRILYILITAILANYSFAQSPKPADPQSGPIAVVNATIHVGNGQVIEEGYVAFDNGKITGVGTGSAPSVAGQTVIDASGKHVYPGLIMPASILGLEEVAAVRATRDYDEVGDITPNVRSQIAFNTDSEILPTYRFNGILTAQVTPQGGLVTGTSSVMMLDGWNWEDATLKKDDAVHIDWPAKTYGPRWWMGETERRPNENYAEQVGLITDLLSDANAYVKGDNNPINLKLEAMRGVLDGSQRVFVYANSASVIVEAVKTLLDNGIKNIVLVGGEDAYYVKDLLVENNIPVILDNIHRVPSRVEEPVDWPFRLPAMLTQAGVQVSLRHSGMLSRGRNLPFYAGTAAAYGLEKEEALKMITSNTAKALGIDSQMGTVETGKDATLLIVKGDLLDMRSSIIEKAFIQGRDVEIEGKQQVLYERFKEKYSK